MKTKLIELKNSITDIRQRNCPIKRTTQDVWGKEVRRYSKTAINGVYSCDRAELENWYIRLPLTEKTHIPTLVECFKSLVEEKEYGLVKDNYDKYTIYELVDWTFLENEKGEIEVINGKVVLVKYAVCLEDLE